MGLSVRYPIHAQFSRLSDRRWQQLMFPSFIAPIAGDNQSKSAHLGLHPSSFRPVPRASALDLRPGCRSRTSCGHFDRPQS